MIKIHVTWLRVKQNLESRRIILDNDCWILKDNKYKYPMMSIEGRKILVSKIACLVFLNMEIKNQALHKCDNPYCWNPKHIFDGTQSDNRKDSISKGRSLFPNNINHYRTHCPNGHEHNEQNTHYYKRGNRINKVCKICTSNRQIKRREFQRGIIMAARDNQTT